MRDDRWSESIAVGTLGFIDKVKSQLGFKAAGRDVVETDGSYALREPAEAYALKFAAKIEALRSQNTFFWNEIVDEATTQRGPTRLVYRIEEIENGVSQRNLTGLIALLRSAAGIDKAVQRGYNTQFIVTSHSPSTLREFADDINHVYNVRLERAGFKSVVVNLSDVLKSFVGIGMVTRKA